MHATEHAFTAQVITGAGRGKHMNIPTINVDLADVPKTLSHGIYACAIYLPAASDKALMGALHYGPRPVFDDTDSCEVHIIDADIHDTPTSIRIDILERLRGVQDFDNADALVAQIHQDIDRVRSIFTSHA